MKLTTIQWNIGGGLIRKADDPAEGPYGEDGMFYIESLIRTLDPDVITFQETHSDERRSQVKILAEVLGRPYSFNDVYACSHIDPTQQLGQGVISRYPFTEHSFTLLYNPHATVTRPNGELWVSHDKGVSRCDVSLGLSRTLSIATLHALPFRKYGIDPLDACLQPLRDDMCRLATPPKHPYLLQGDFNIDNVSLEHFLPPLFKNGVSEVKLTEPTTPRGRQYDHVLFSSMTHIRSEVLSSALTDHYPVFSEFEIEG